MKPPRKPYAKLPRWAREIAYFHDRVADEMARERSASKKAPRPNPEETTGNTITDGSDIEF